ncbi:N-acetylneuraminate lyase-like [Ostrinia furnacalis]|uniref:N-acetylneuraminate lyase-like n=1 Tax=Ostrinia furnacalis TaxID=93504 RepID=UPI00103B3F54|nr:N-acetylneuraminate lyase-like [Ostrinia furnacalis]
MVFFDVQGIIAPVFTPIDRDGNVNLTIIPGYAAYLKEHNVDGILVGGTTGELASLNLDERKELLGAWIKETKPLGLKVIAQVGGMPLPDVIAMAKYASEVNADAIMSLPELYFKPKTPTQLVDYLEIVSQAAPSLPLIYYHFPMMSGVDLNMADFFNLASTRIPNFKGMKADMGVALQVAKFFKGDQRIFIANHLLAPSVFLGHESSIATVTNIFPDIVHDVVESTKAGDVTRAREGQEKLNRLVDAIASQGDFVPSMKVAMELVTGIKVGPPRRPLAPIDDLHVRQLAENLKHLDLEIKM